METEGVESLIERLEASEQRYQSFIANSSEQIWCVEFDHPIPLDLPEMEQAEQILDQAYYAEVNETFAQAYGAKREEVLGWRLVKTLPRSEPSTIKFLLEAARARYHLSDLESLEVAKDGSERVIVNNMIGVIEGEHLQRVWGTARDITHFRNTEKAIELRSIAIETMRDGCIIVDAKSVELPIVYSNQQFSEITGYSQSELKGKTLGLFQGPGTCPRTAEAISVAMQEKEPFSGEVLNYRKDGQSFVNYLRLTPVFQDGGTLTHYVGIQSDITARRKAEELVVEKGKALEVELARGNKARAELQSLTERLLDAQENERKRLARDLHDDLTQRLAALALEAGSLSASGVVSEALARISRELTELAGATQEFSRQLHPSIIKDLGLIRALGSECRRFSKRTGIKVSFDSDEFDDILPGEASLCVYRILQESLSNVSKHSGASAVEVEWTGDSLHLTLRVRDNGAGFDGSSKPTAHTLGLISMTERARHCDGQLSVESKAGAGTTITLKLPRSHRPES